MISITMKGCTTNGLFSFVPPICPGRKIVCHKNDAKLPALRGSAYGEEKCGPYFTIFFSNAKLFLQKKNVDVFPKVRSTCLMQILVSIVPLCPPVCPTVPRMSAPKTYTSLPHNSSTAAVLVQPFGLLGINLYDPLPCTSTGNFWITVTSNHLQRHAETLPLPAAAAYNVVFFILHGARTSCSVTAVAFSSPTL